jgi:hypothetical protein
MQEILPSFHCVCDAFLTETPFETAMTLLYRNSMGVEKHRFETFITERAARKWLQEQK